VSIQVRTIVDPDLERSWLAILTDVGFDPVVKGPAIQLHGVGVAHADQSVNLTIQLLDMDGHRVLAIHAPISAQPATYDLACLAGIRGGGACHLAKIDVVERFANQDQPHRFGLIARFHLYADHLSAQELQVMLQLFLKEVDEVDNELVAIMTDP